jgi:hypothetical protein
VSSQYNVSIQHNVQTPYYRAERYNEVLLYIITERYTPKEFYSVIIDTGTSKKSTIGYGQHLTYKTTINDNMDINIMQTGAVNI